MHLQVDETTRAALLADKTIRCMYRVPLTGLNKIRRKAPAVIWGQNLIDEFCEHLKKAMARSLRRGSLAPASDPVPDPNSGLEITSFLHIVYLASYRMALLLFDVFLPDVDDEVRHAMEKSIDQPIHFAFRQSSDGSLHLQRREKLDDKAHSHYQGTLMVDQTSPPYVKDGLFAHNYINGVREERDDIHGDSPLQKGPPPRLPASMQKAAEWHAKTLAAERGESGPGQKEDIRYITTWKDEAR